MEEERQEDISIYDFINHINEQKMRTPRPIISYLQKFDLLGNYQNVFKGEDGKFYEQEMLEDRFYDNEINQFLVFSPKYYDFNYYCEKLLNGAIFQFIEDKWVQVCFPIPNAHIFRDHLDRRIKKPYGNIINDFINKYDNNGTYTVENIYDGTVMNAYFSLLHGYWLISTKHISDILSKTWRGIKWSEVFSRCTNILNSFKHDTGFTYIMNVSDTRIHYLTNKNECHVLAKANMKGISYNSQSNISNENIKDSANEVFNKIKHSKCKQFQDYQRSIVGYIFRFDNRNDVMILSNAFHHITSLAYFDHKICNKEDFRTLEYVVANTYVNGNDFIEKYFPKLVVFYNKIREAENVISNVIVNCSFNEEDSNDKLKCDDPLINLCIDKGRLIYKNGYISDNKTEEVLVFGETDKKQRLSLTKKYISDHRNFDLIFEIVKLIKPFLEFDVSQIPKPLTVKKRSDK